MSENQVGRPPKKQCVCRRYQGFMIYIDADKSWLRSIQQYFDGFGVLFPPQKEVPAKELYPTDRWWAYKKQLYLGTNECLDSSIKINDAVKSFQNFMDKQFNKAPSSAECEQKRYENEVAARLGEK